jgi:hypothetical protein
MKTKHILMAAMVCMAIGMGVVTAEGGGSAAAGPKGYYLDCIDKEIQSAGGKVSLVESRSENLKSCGIQAARRVQYLMKNREALAQEMAERGVSMRPHAVHQFLLNRFNENMTELAANGKP